jgi:hypothetical protein
MVPSGLISRCGPSSDIPDVFRALFATILIILSTAAALLNIAIAIANLFFRLEFYGFWGRLL